MKHLISKFDYFRYGVAFAFNRKYVKFYNTYTSSMNEAEDADFVAIRLGNSLIDYDAREQDASWAKRLTVLFLSFEWGHVSMHIDLSEDVDNYNPVEVV